MKKTAVLILAEGFEEIEAITPVDVLRRAGVEVIVCSLDKKEVKGAHGIYVVADCLISEVPVRFDALILPGGGLGAFNLHKSSQVSDLIKNQNDQKKLIAAICASPSAVLAPLGVLDGKTATCFPGCEENFGQKIIFSDERVVKDGNIITSRGAGTAFEFSLEISKSLMGEEIAGNVANITLFL